MQNKADIEVLRAFYPLHQPGTHKAVYGGHDIINHPVHAVVGALVGQVVPPIPIVGAFVGAQVGAHIGHVAAQGDRK